MAQTDLTIAGVGGQGSILAGVILGSAAVTFDDKYATRHKIESCNKIPPVFLMMSLVRLCAVLQAHILLHRLE